MFRHAVSPTLMGCVIQPCVTLLFFFTFPSQNVYTLSLYWHVDILSAAGIVRTVSATPAAITTNLISSSSVTTAVSAASNPGIQTGSIRVVQPHQLTGTTATTILAPVSIL